MDRYKARALREDSRCSACWWGRSVRSSWASSIPYVVNKAGPDWLWGGGRDDVLRNLYFRHDGSFRRYGRIALVATLFGGLRLLFWML